MICQPVVSPHLALVGPAVGPTASRIYILLLISARDGCGCPLTPLLGVPFKGPSASCLWLS